MKKFLLTSATLVLMVCVCVTGAYANDFTVQAYMPPANGASFTVTKVQGSTWTKLDTTNLDFGTLSVNDDGIFLPDYYWVIDIASNGSGNPDVDAAYTDTANPNGDLNDGTGLGRKGTISFAEVIYGDPDDTVNDIDGMSLEQTNLVEDEIQEEDFANGWLRATVGIATGDTSLDEGNAEVFTAADATGTYSGTLTLTATFD